METCASFRLSPALLTSSTKIYDHVKSHLKSAMIQFSDLNTTPVMSIISNMGSAGIVTFQLTGAVSDTETLAEITEPLAFRNHSFGGTYLHSREFFGKEIEDILVRFYKRASTASKLPEFVETKITYNNSITETRHTSTVDSHVSPVEKYLQKCFVKAKLILSIKTCTMLQKWLRQNKNKSPVARLHINETLTVLVVTVGDECTTIEFKSFVLEPADAFLTLDKPGNFGAVLVDCTAVVNLECLIQAIGICKVPSVCVPAFKFYSGGIVEVSSAHLKQSKSPSATVSTVLLDASESLKQPAEQEQPTTSQPSDPQSSNSVDKPSPPRPSISQPVRRRAPPRAIISDSEEDSDSDSDQDCSTETQPETSYREEPKKFTPKPTAPPNKRKQFEPLKCPVEKKKKSNSNSFVSII
ncbi:processivity factor [Alcelaphine gammaherpesvirus 1]|uniref:DNA polymerase processivity factor n=1 Tax=Alcelaphine herpesvirus 1 (strain C500) TaxID=654901 RepID=VG59_ALHV1|nr:processivity factor [Alcelaphine gammaherpesvirus 1]O36409.1 RecName: Full=DNA polymerase processivity factor [Alcelaphine herpesvirus 1 strain C500]AAC58106.1 processivity factor [Alcelaphine gammaherpesvirus 1]APB09482.1 DNA polymerase processivity subunit [Alcelaphine gammaherpesvirus 1]APB09554.1 DNA polymerase processivity subunit [Alcelaphine gammaherpesvirus 1]ATI21945.1 ORF59 [Alcelaphine gammaherpesvirus 1]QDY92292.1 DNA polymerase processivity subunit [Alcelaphine gammaherpesviru